MVTGEKIVYRATEIELGSRNTRMITQKDNSSVYNYGRYLKPVSCKRNTFSKSAQNLKTFCDFFKQAHLFCIDVLCDAICKIVKKVPIVVESIQTTCKLSTLTIIWAIFSNLKCHFMLFTTSLSAKIILVCLFTQLRLFHNQRSQSSIATTI